jgi:hypothetical protein
MTLTAALLGAILLVIIGGGILLYRALLAIVRLLEQINGKLPFVWTHHLTPVNLTRLAPTIVAQRQSPLSEVEGVGYADQEHPPSPNPRQSSPAAVVPHSIHRECYGQLG